MKIVIIGGAGGTGSSAAFSLLTSPSTFDIVLIDTRPNMLTSHLMDLENVTALNSSRSTIRAGTNHDIRDASVVVLAASVPLRPSTSRGDFLAENTRTISEYLAPLRDPSFTGVVLVLTNPVDALVTWIFGQTGLPWHRLIGYSLNDTLRLRTGIAQALGIHPNDVGAWVTGEHGPGQVPLFSGITINGEPVTLTSQQQLDASRYISTWYDRHVSLESGRTSTWATGLGAATMINAIAAGTHALFPASVMLSGQYGITGVSLTVPITIGRYGVAQILEWNLHPSEQEAMAEAAKQISEAVRPLGQI